MDNVFSQGVSFHLPLYSFSGCCQTHLLAFLENGHSKLICVMKVVPRDLKELMEGIEKLFGQICNLKRITIYIQNQEEI